MRRCNRVRKSAKIHIKNLAEKMANTRPSSKFRNVGTIFRYPGSKFRLLGKLAPHLEWLLEGQTSFHEVFTGGGSVLLYVAKRWPRLELHANDLDPNMAAFWRVVIGTESAARELCSLIRHARPSVPRFYALKEGRPSDDVDRAFKALAVNRWSYGGLATGLLEGGGKMGAIESIHVGTRRPCAKESKPHISCLLNAAKSTSGMPCNMWRTSRDSRSTLTRRISRKGRRCTTFPWTHGSCGT